ncbi:methylamine utilization protein [Rhodoferax sp.]|uniref:methylamine utilization protein n=1 Tax=Rhodoferax sp. TaxID=50421 RepID=UPI002ACE1061|nr:methylamine utilization protein [Rhodoferax sp.]MDZ7921106.1 methylamine utilization protein [Rhodoferax sp.]
MAAVVGVWGVLQTAGAGTLQLQVQDKNGKPLPDAIVFLESAEAKAAAKPLKGVEVAQIGRQFKPAVTVVTPGTSILFPNQDTVRHHVYSFSPAKTFELKLYAGVPANPVVFDKVGIAVLGCNIHDNMVAWVLVVDTPYFGHTDAQGKVTLGDVPNGSYKLRTWHASLPTGAPAAEQAQAVGASPATVLVKLAGSSS